MEIDRKKLINMALDNLKNSYAPYSNFNVSAAVLMGSGKIYTGVNVESAAFSSGICAERNAIFHAISCGEKEIVAIVIVGGKDGKVSTYTAPCGTCRQVMREFSDPKKVKVIMAIDENDYKEMTLEEMLPLSFGPNSMI